MHKEATHTIGIVYFVQSTLLATLRHRESVAVNLLGYTAAKSTVSLDIQYGYDFKCSTHLAEARTTLGVDVPVGGLTLRVL